MWRVLMCWCNSGACDERCRDRVSRVRWGSLRLAVNASSTSFDERISFRPPYRTCRSVFEVASRAWSCQHDASVRFFFAKTECKKESSYIRSSSTRRFDFTVAEGTRLHIKSQRERETKRVCSLSPLAAWVLRFSRRRLLDSRLW